MVLSFYFFIHHQIVTANIVKTAKLVTHEKLSLNSTFIPYYLFKKKHQNPLIYSYLHKTFPYFSQEPQSIPYF